MNAGVEAGGSGALTFGRPRIRLQEFFDHYLKGDPMPYWMKEGIPMTRKGQELRYGPKPE